LDRESPSSTASKGGRRGRRGTGKVRITDVAKLAGVAPITVSRVLNAPDSVAAETLRRVRDAIDRTGYVPNMLAGGLASSRSRLIAALVPTIASPVFQDTWGALTDTFANAGYHVTFGQTGYGDSREEALLDAIIARRPDGIVLTGIVRSPRGRRRLLAADIPVVETWDLTPTPIDMLVGFSHEKIGAAVAEYLYAKGKRRIAVITAADERARRRASGLTDAAARLGIATTLAAQLPMFVAPAPGTLGSGRQGLADLLARHPGIDAVFCSSDMLALGAVIEAQSRGIPVPGAVGVVGYGDLNFATDTVPPLTTVSVDGPAIGRQAARLIIDRAQGRSVAEPVVDVGFSIVARASA
jgi:LacI family transcriptional regulator, gluconate utilization system Gnt-I transcriptional repressor